MVRRSVRRNLPSNLTGFLCVGLAGVLLLQSSWAVKADSFDPPPDYYQLATGVGSLLKEQLAATMSIGHVQRSYGNFRDSARLTDADPQIPGNILLAYNRASVSADWDSGTTWNREHLWPQSRQPGSASNGSHGNLGDPHALRPANPSINSSRGNKPFGFDDTEGSYGSLGSYYFPGDVDKGDVARALFYSDTRYPSSGLSLTDSFPTGNQMGELASLVAWHYLDPPDDFERRRNQIIYSQADNPNYFTNNRNAYIDRPEYAWSIYKDQFNDSRLWVGSQQQPDGSSMFEIDLGSILVGAPVPSAQEVTLFKDGYDGTYFEISASGEATTSLLGRNHSFAINTLGSDSRLITVGLDSPTNLAGRRYGTLEIDNLDVTLEGGVGMGGRDENDSIQITLDVLDHANGSFAGRTNQKELLLDFGTVAQSTSSPMLDFSIFNLTNEPQFTARLQLDTILGKGDVSMLTTNLVPFTGQDALAAGSENRFLATLDTSNPGDFSASYTFGLSDEGLPGASVLEPLTLILRGSVENEVGLDSADFDQDSDIDGVDFITWQRGLGKTDGATRSQGDANGDQSVDALDLAIWQEQFQANRAAHGLVVAEPASLSLWIVMLIASTWRIKFKVFPLHRASKWLDSEHDLAVLK